MLCVHWAAAQQSLVDSLEKRLLQSEGLEKAQILHQLAGRYIGQEPAKALAYAQKAYQQAQTLRNQPFIIDCQNRLGSVKVSMAAYAEALSYHQKALVLAQGIGDSNRVAESLKFIGNAYYYLATYQTAVEYYYQSLQIYERIQDVSGQSKILNNLGNVFIEMGEYEKALGYFQDSFLTDQRLNDVVGMMISVNNIGNAYRGLRDYEKSLEYYNRYLQMTQELQTRKGLTIVYNNIGEIYLEQKKYTEALVYLEKGLALADELQNLDEQANFLQNLGKVRLAQGQAQQALVYGQQALAKVRQSKSLKLEAEIQRFLAETYFILGDMRNAYLAEKSFSDLSSTILSEKSRSKILKIEEIYENEKQQRLIERLEREKKLQVAENQLQEKRLQARKLLAIGTSIIAALLFVVAFISYKRYQIKQEANNSLLAKQAQISSQNEALARSQQIIQEQNELLKSANSALEEKVNERTEELKKSYLQMLELTTQLDNFLYRASHDLKGPIARLIGLCNIGLIDVSDEKGKDYLKRLQQNALSMDGILSGLLLVNDVRSVVLSPQSISVKENIQEIFMQLVRNSPLLTKVILHVEAPEDCRITTDTYLFEIVWRNLLQNAISYRDESKVTEIHVYVSAAEAPQQGWQILLSDNGMGISREFQAKLFEVFAKDVASKGVGLGLYTVRLALNRLGGSIRLLESYTGNTQFQLYLPSTIGLETSLKS
jgi:signal transduction histidine kinase